MLEQKGLCTAEEWQRHHMQKDKPAGLGVVHYPQPIHQQGPLETSKVRTDYNNYYYMPNPVFGKSLCSDWLFLSQDFAVLTDCFRGNGPIRVFLF